VDINFRGRANLAQRKAILLVALMLLLPWASVNSPELTSIDDDSSTTARTWGAMGSNDTGWVDIVATGADPANQTFAYGELSLDFAPGAEISNLTFEISVDGSDGYCMEEPQLTLLETQTPILDWRNLGGLGCQDSFTNNPPNLEEGTLSTWLQPNTISDAAWTLPAGITISDLVMEVLTPSDPKVSFSTLDVVVHDSAVNPLDGRLYILLDNDLIHLDSDMAETCGWRCPGIIHIDSDIAGSSLAVDESGNRLIIGKQDGSISSQSLIDSSFNPDLLPSASDSEPVAAMSVDQYGNVWAASGCSLKFLPNGGAWSDITYCPGSPEVPVDIESYGDKIFLATQSTGIHVIDYTYNATSSSIAVAEAITIWDTNNFLSSNSITDLEIASDQLLISTLNAGINRRDLSASSWLSRWNTNNWLASNSVVGISHTSGWIHIVAGTTLHSYDTTANVFRSQRQVSQLGLLGSATSVSSWPSGIGPRSPADGVVFLIDSTGRAGMQHAETVIGAESLVSSPVSDPMRVAARIDDGESGQIWVAGDTTIDRFDEGARIWQAPIDVSDYAGQQLQTITSIVQDSNDRVWVGTSNSGILRFRADNGAYIGTINGIEDQVISMAHDDTTETLVVGHPFNGLSLVNTSTMTLIDVLDTTDGLDSDLITDVATRYGIAYAATSDSGLMRIDLMALQILGSWQSLGADNLEAAPIAVDEDVIYLGLPDFGILLLDRINGDIIDYWEPGGSNGLPDDDVLSLHMLGSELVVGSRVSNTGAQSNGGLAIWDGASWEQLPTSIQGWNNDPYVFYDITSDGSDIYAGTNRGACRWAVDSNGAWQLDVCVDQGDGMPARQIYSVQLIGSNTLYAGTDNGAAVINTLNGSVMEVWNAGDDTQRARTVKIDDILYLGFENTGIARYDLINDQWLTTWDGTQGYINDDDVTALVEGTEPGTMWVGGDFGLTLIDVANDQVLIDWDRGANSGGPTLSNQIPADIVIMGDVLHYSTQRSNQWWATNDEITRIALNNNTSLTNLEAGTQLGFDSVVYGIGQVGDELWIGVRPTQYWNYGDGTVVRWNTVNETWSDNLGTIGNVLRVNARLLGDCFPLNASSCEMWVAYGDNIMRRFSFSTMTLLNEWSNIDGPIRGMVEFDGEYLFASMNGILRWNPSNETWLTPWTATTDLPNNAEEEFYSMTVIGDDLWASSMESSGWNSDAQIFRKNGTTGNWTAWDLGTGDIPDGYGADIVLCDDIVHVAIGRRFWWGNQGGVARFDLADHDSDGQSDEWISPLTEGGTNGLANPDARALACDESNRILYVGYDEEGVGFDRMNYNTGNFLTTLTSADGISEDRVFPGGMLHDGNVLLAAHQFDNTGGVSRIVTSGTSASSGQVIDPGMDGCSIVRVPSTSTPVYAVGRSGQTTGLNRVDRLDSTGLIAGGFDELAGLSSGRVVEFASNSTHVWVSSTLSEGSYYGSSILQGEILLNGSVRWEDGYSLLGQDVVNSMTLQDETMWITTAGRGLWSVDLSQRSFSPTPAALHVQMDGMVLEDDGTMYVGLMGYQGSAAGFQEFDTSTGSWGYGSLLAGLPNDRVRDFAEVDDKILIATWGGIGVRNTTTSEWEDPITTIDGLPMQIYEHLLVLDDPIQGDGHILAGGPAGLTVLATNLSVITTLNSGDGLMGETVSGLVYAPGTSRTVVNDDGTTTVLYHDASVFISHNGQGSTRPGVVAWDIATDRANGTYQIDKIPSNDVRAIATDYWGVHIATDVAPMVHWNASTLNMESGSPSNTLQSWPPTELVSDGTHLAMISPGGIDVMEVESNHDVVASTQIIGPRGAHLHSTGLYVVSDEGLHHFDPVGSLVQRESDNQRVAHPLSAIYSGRIWENIQDTARPGMQTVLVDDEEPMDIDMVSEMPLAGRLPMHTGALTLTSPQSGAWIWAESAHLNYSGIWDMAAMNPGIQPAFQSAISSVGPGSTSAETTIQLQSPHNGQIKVRVTYDWQRIEVPTTLTNLSDRPNDGGGVLEATWLPAEDAAWSGYRIYVWDATGKEQWNPNADELSDFTTYMQIPFWSQTSALVTEADNDGTPEPLSDDRVYRAAIAIEYPDGSLGDAMAWPGSVSPSDEVPAPPTWLVAEPISGGSAGAIVLEWSACDELDPDKTRIWPVQQEISSAVALTGEIDIPFSAGNTTVLDLEPNSLYWLVAACVDEAGQFDPNNVTIFGPVVTAGGLNDGIAPSPITDTFAQDVPGDEGGRIQVTWTPNSEEDCSYHTVYALPASGWQPPSTVDGWPVAAYVDDCTTGEAFIDSLGSSPLQDGVTYWIGVVASDDWGNENLDAVLVVEATPTADTTGVGNAPPRVEGLIAWDHPDDDGTAIDIVWDRSTAPDFSHYTIWVSDYPLNDLTGISEKCETSNCNLIEVDQRQIGGLLQLQITVGEALYGSTVGELSPAQIEPDIPLYVTITVHDIKGNVFLTGLDEHMVLVSPVDNRGDITPPERLAAPVLEDRSPDDGDGIIVTFPESEASDVTEYWVFSDVVPFSDTKSMTPVAVVNRNDPMPVTIEHLSDGRPLAPSIMTWVAVAPVDSAGNVWLTNLKPSSIALVDENSLDPGLHLDEVTGVRGYWDSAGTKIDVTWDLSSDPQVESYRVFISLDPFEDTRNASQIGGDIEGTLLILNDFNGEPLNNEQSYWAVVVGYDGEVHRLAVDPLEILPWSESSFGSIGGDDSESGASWIDQLLSGDMNELIAVASALMILAGALLFIRPRKDEAPQPWEMGALEVELEEQMMREASGLTGDEEFGIDDMETSADSFGTMADVPASTYDGMSEGPTAQPIGGDIPDSTPGTDTEVMDELLGEEPEEVDLDDLDDLADDLDIDDLDDLAGDLGDEDVDTSFLDDML